MKVTWPTMEGGPLQCYVLGSYLEVGFGSFSDERGKQPLYDLPNAIGFSLALERDPVHHNQQNIHSFPLGNI